MFLRVHKEADSQYGELASIFGNLIHWPSFLKNKQMIKIQYLLETSEFI